MRIAKTIDDVNIMLQEIWEWKDKISTKDWDFRGLKIKNASPAVDNNDYVVKSQIPSIPDIPDQREQHYTLFFTNDDVVVDSQVGTSAIIGQDRVGYPIEVMLYSKGSPITAPLTMNAQINGVKLLSADISLGVGVRGPVTSSLWVTPIPKFGHLAVITPTVTIAGGASGVTLAIVIRRLNQNGM